MAGDKSPAPASQPASFQGVVQWSEGPEDVMERMSAAYQISFRRHWASGVPVLKSSRSPAVENAAASTRVVDVAPRTGRVAEPCGGMHSDIHSAGCSLDLSPLPPLSLSLSPQLEHGRTRVRVPPARRWRATPAKAYQRFRVMEQRSGSGGHEQVGGTNPRWPIRVECPRLAACRLLQAAAVAAVAPRRA